MDSLSNITKGGEKGGKDHLLMLMSTLQKMYTYPKVVIIFSKISKKVVGWLLSELRGCMFPKV